MSIRYGLKSAGIQNRKTQSFAHNRSFAETSTIVGNLSADWVRPAEWISVTPPTTSEEKIILVISVAENDSNLIAFRIQGDYDVDWGDGNVSTGIVSNTISSYEYDYNSISASVLSDGTKQVQLTITPNGASNLTLVSLAELHPSMGGITTNNYSQPIIEVYLSCPSLTSLTGLGGSLTSGVNTIRITNVELINTGNLTTFASLFANALGLQRVYIGTVGNITSTAYMFDSCRSLRSAPMFDTSNVTTMYYMFIFCQSLIYVPEYNTSNVTSFAGMFRGNNITTAPMLDTSNALDVSSMFYQCYNLQSIPLYNISKATNTANMFYFCYSLRRVPLLDTSKSTNMSSMFRNCNDLREVPLFNTSNVTSMSNMFDTCNSLRTVPKFDTSKVTNMGGMFTSCTSLVAIPEFDTSSVTNMGSMFQSCTSLVTIPLLNTSNVTSMNAMFKYCYNLYNIPHLDTSNVTNMASMFDSAFTLQSIPHLDTSSVTNMAAMFTGCFSLLEVPNLDTSKVTSIASMFSSCYSLTKLPVLDLPLCTSIDSFIRYCYSITKAELTNTNLVIDIDNAFGSAYSLVSVDFDASGVTSTTTTFGTAETLSRAVLSGLSQSISFANTLMSKESYEELFRVAGVGTGKTLTITSSYGAIKYPAVSVASVTTTANSLSATTSSSVASLTAGMQATGTGTPLTTTRSVTFTDAGDIVTLADHGLSDGDKVSFSAITTTTGISIYNIYYVVNASVSDFQLASTLGGAPLPLTNDGTGTIRYRAIIENIIAGSPNVIVFDRPMASSATSTLSFRYLHTADALLKNWTVTG